MTSGTQNKTGNVDVVDTDTARFSVSGSTLNATTTTMSVISALDFSVSATGFGGVSGRAIDNTVFAAFDYGSTLESLRPLAPQWLEDRVDDAITKSRQRRKRRVVSSRRSQK